MRLGNGHGWILPRGSHARLLAARIQIHIDPRFGTGWGRAESQGAFAVLAILPDKLADVRLAKRCDESIGKAHGTPVFMKSVILSG